jgi:hypothetical protein
MSTSGKLVTNDAGNNFDSLARRFLVLIQLCGPKYACVPGLQHLADAQPVPLATAPHNFPAWLRETRLVIAPLCSLYSLLLSRMED